MSSLPQKLDLPKMQTTWAQLIEPVLNNPIVQGNQLKQVQLSAGNNTINHKLGRNLQGYIVTAMYSSYAQIYTQPSNFPELLLVLNASAPTIVDIYVY